MWKNRLVSVLFYPPFSFFFLLFFFSICFFVRLFPSFFFSVLSGYFAIAFFPFIFIFYLYFLFVFFWHTEGCAHMVRILFFIYSVFSVVGPNPSTTATSIILLILFLLQFIVKINSPLLHHQSLFRSHRLYPTVL